MLTIKKYSFYFRNTPNGVDVIKVELNEKIDTKVLLDSVNETLSVPTMLGTLKFDVTLAENIIYLSTNDKNKFNDVISGSNNSLKNCVQNYINFLNKKMKDLENE